MEPPLVAPRKNIGKWIVLVIVAAVGVAGAVLAFRRLSRDRDLTETLAWIEQTYNPHNGGANYGLGHGTEIHYRENLDTHTAETTEEFHETFVSKGGCTVVLHHETSPVGIFKTVYSKGDYTLSLCDVDPASISIRKYDFHKDIFDCSDPEQVKLYELNCTSAEVEFHIRNDAPKIQDDSLVIYAELTGKDHEAQVHKEISKGWFSVDDAAYAERLAKAFRHAVELCGGQSSKF